MIVRVAFFILMSLGLIGFGTVAWITTRPMGLGGPPPTKMILVAAQAIDAGSLLTSDDLQQKEIPINEMTKEYNLDTPDIRRGLMGAMVKRNLGVGEAIRSDDLMRPIGSRLHGRGAVAGDARGDDQRRCRQRIVRPDLAGRPGRPDSDAGEQRSEHRRLAGGSARTPCFRTSASSPSTHNWSPGQTETPPQALDAQNRTVTLEVDEDQAQRVAVGMRLGRLSVSVRASSTVAGNAKTPYEK